MKSRIAVSLLTGALLAMLAVTAYQAHIIAAQRELILKMWEYIQLTCPIQ